MPGVRAHVLSGHFRGRIEKIFPITSERLFVLRQVQILSSLTRGGIGVGPRLQFEGTD